MTCALVPLMPKLLTPMRRGRPSGASKGIASVGMGKGWSVESRGLRAFSCKCGVKVLCCRVSTALMNPATPAAISR